MFLCLQLQALDNIQNQSSMRAMPLTHYAVSNPALNLRSPLQYKDLSSLAVEKVTVPVERTYVCIDPTNGESALLTPVCPCIAVIGRNTLKKNICIIHVFYTNKVADIPDILKEQLFGQEQYCSDNVSITLFSKQMPEKEYIEGGWLKRHNNKTQQQQMDYIRENLISALNLSNNAIDTCLLEAEGNQDVVRTLLITGETNQNGGLQLYHSLAFSERLIKIPYIVVDYTINMTVKHYGERASIFHNNHIYSYDSTEFFQSPKNNLKALINTPIPLKYHIVGGLYSSYAVCKRFCFRNLIPHLCNNTIVRYTVLGVGLLAGLSLLRGKKAV